MRELVERNEIDVFQVTTTAQRAVMLTEALDAPAYISGRNGMCLRLRTALTRV